MSFTPKTNFYRSVNQHMTRIIKPDAMVSSVFTDIQEHIDQELYDAPFDKDSVFLHTVHAPMQKAHSLPPVIEQRLKEIKAIQSWDEIPNQLFYLHRDGVSNCIFNVEYDPDLRDPKTYMWYLKVAPETFPMEEHKHVSSYFQTLHTQFLLSFDEFDFQAFEKRLQEKAPDPARTQDVLYNFNPITYQDTKKSRNLSWLRIYMDNYETRVDKSWKTLVVSHKPYFQFIGDLMRKGSIKEWRTYLQWKWLHHVGRWFEGHTAYFDHIGRHRGQKEPVSDRKLKMVLARIVWWQDAGMQYIKINEEWLKEARVLVSAMTQHLIHEARLWISNLNVHDKTKTEALMKLSHMKLMIGWSSYNGPQPHIPDLHYFDEWILFGHRYQWRILIDAFQNEVNYDTWRFCSHADVNAFYSQGLNSIFVPASLFRAPLFHVRQCDKHIEENLAGLGTIIAHEISHAIDSESRHIDHTGRLREWWVKQDLQRYEKNAKKVKHIYRTHVDLGGKVDVQLTLTENIADIIGIQLAVATMKSMTSKDPSAKFFRAFARTRHAKLREKVAQRDLLTDEHAPEELRTNISVALTPEFKAAFRIKKNDPMFIKSSDRPAFFMIKNE